MSDNTSTATMGIRLRRGRDFSIADARFALPLVRYWNEQPYPARFDEPQPALPDNFAEGFLDKVRFDLAFHLFAINAL